MESGDVAIHAAAGIDEKLQQNFEALRSEVNIGCMQTDVCNRGPIHFVPWTFRTMDLSYPGGICTLDLSYPEDILTLELSYSGDIHTLELYKLFI